MRGGGTCGADRTIAAANPAVVRLTRWVCRTAQCARPLFFVANVASRQRTDEFRAFRRPPDPAVYDPDVGAIRSEVAA